MKFFSLWSLVVFRLICIGQIGCSMPPFGEPTSSMIVRPIRDFSVVSKSEAWVVTDKFDLIHLKLNDENIYPVNERLIDKLTDVQKVSFPNSAGGWALDVQGNVWNTNNGGEDWVRLSQTDSHWSVGWGSRIAFTDERNGWLKARSNLLHTDDGGVSWVNVYSGRYGASPSELSALEGDSAWLGIGDGTIWRTDNARSGWQNVSIPFRWWGFPLYAIDSRTCLLGVEGGLVRTRNGGKTWNQVLSNGGGGKLVIHSISFPSPDTGWAAGARLFLDEDPWRSTFAIFTTKDGGQSWKEIKSNLDEDTVQTVEFVDDKNGWLTSDKTVYVTRDGGKSWDKVKSI